MSTSELSPGDLTDLIATLRPPAGSETDRLPSRLSPSRANDFLTCPRMFWFKTIVGIPSPPTLATVKGNVAHAAFERIFDHPAGERTLEHALTYARAAWDTMTDPVQSPDGYEQNLLIAPRGSQIEADMFVHIEQMISSWFKMERVDNFSPVEILLPDGSTVDGRELHVAAEIGGVNLHGYIDRLDRWQDTDGTVHYSVSDYKTGKVPADRYLDKYWFQLRVYAVLVEAITGVAPSLLRLVFVSSGDRERGIKTLPVTPAVLDATRKQVRTLWEDMSRAARTGVWAEKVGPLCNYCYFQSECPAWNPGLDGLQVSA